MFLKPKFSVYSTERVQKAIEFYFLIIMFQLEISNDSQQSSLTEDQGLHPVRLVKEILDNQEILSKHRGNEEDKLKETWSYKLGSPEVVTKLVDISDRLSNIIERKETLLETLRNPIAENSIPWKKEKQIDLVQTINYLVSFKVYIAWKYFGDFHSTVAA